jgi:pectate disaccharide-lyase
LTKDIYVSPSGNNNNPGTVDAPLANIQTAIDAVLPGGTIFLKGGVYHQTVKIQKSGSESEGFITLRSAEGEHAILDGTGVKVDTEGICFIIDASYVQVQDIELRNYRTEQAGTTPIGIFVKGASHHIGISGNIIHDMGTDFQGHNGGDAHGIAVYGTSDSPQHDIFIDFNELYNLKLGSSEALAINGNVDGFRVVRNSIHDNNNIGIVIIGFEGVSPDPANDRARNGVILQNHVYNISSYRNPAYGNQYAAAGIYVDGGTKVSIEDNDIHDNDYGIELASEHAGGKTSEVEALHNRIYHNRASGISLGGYDEHRGSTLNCVIQENELIYNNANHLGYGELNLAFDTRSNQIINNQIKANEDGLMITNEFKQNLGNTIDYNVYTSKGNPQWSWKGEKFNDFVTYMKKTSNDLHSSIELIK